MNEIGFDSLDEAAQLVRGPADRERTKPLPDRCAQTDGSRRGGAGALRRVFESAKRNRNDLESADGEIQSAGERGSNVHLVHGTVSIVRKIASRVASFRKMADPILCNGGAAVCHEEEAHRLAIIVCPGHKWRFLFSEKRHSLALPAKAGVWP